MDLYHGSREDVSVPRAGWGPGQPQGHLPGSLLLLPDRRGADGLPSSRMLSSPVRKLSRPRGPPRRRHGREDLSRGRGELLSHPGDRDGQERRNRLRPPGRIPDPGCQGGDQHRPIRGTAIRHDGKSIPSGRRSSMSPGSPSGKRFRASLKQIGWSILGFPSSSDVVHGADLSERARPRASPSQELR